MANFNFNKVIIGGRVCNDPELKTTPDGVSVTSFTVAVNSRAKEGTKADYFEVNAWRNTAEFVTKFFRKGSSICVVGVLKNRSWVDRDNVKRYGTSIEAAEVFFVDAKGESAAQTQSSAYVPDAHKGQVTGDAGNFDEITDDDDIPF